jgi:group II intron reverse transcriptase/maturase
LQAALHAKAKRSSDFRFYSLYDKLYRMDVLRHAYALSKANRGVAGVDRQTFDEIESYGMERWLGELAEDLREKWYRPSAVRRVHIPKANGKQRPLGIPTIRDRVVQTAAVLILEPIFEADLQPEQHAYREGHSALDAVRQASYWVGRGYDEVVDADLSGYFDTIPHADLMKSVSRRVSDGAMLSLIKAWLEMPVEEEDARGRRRRSATNRDTGRGTPQGAPISPLLSNLYMRRFLLGWKVLGHEVRLKARVINYADDFVICCRGTGEQAMSVMRRMMEKLKLTVNEGKTRLCHARAEPFNFVGYQIGVLHSRLTGLPYVGARPSPKSVQALVAAVTEKTSRTWLWMDEAELVRQLNRLLNGWANYFCLGPVGCVYRRIDQHVRYRVRRWLCKKHKVRSKGYRRWGWDHFAQVGLVSLRDRVPSTTSCAKA